MLRSLPIEHLDKTLAPWRKLARSHPHKGWLRAIRQALGMTTRQCATAVGVSQAAVVDAERNEARGDISLATLRRYAAALDCELVYALVPKQPLREVVEQRADRIAHDHVLHVRHSMALEQQATSKKNLARDVSEMRAKLLSGRRSRLWQ